MPLKIGIVTQSYYPKPGGVTEVVAHSALELRRRGHEVTVITTSYTGRNGPEPGVIRIGRNVLLPVNGAWVNMTVGIGLKRRLRAIFEREAFDVVHTHCPLVPTLPILTLQITGCGHRIIGTFHATAERHYGYAMFRRPLMKLADRLDARIAVSASAAQFASLYFPGRFEIVPNGIDCERFNPHVEPIAEWRDGRLNVLFVGRMDRRKGLPDLFRAIAIAQKKSKRGIRLILVGEGTLRKVLMPKPLDFHGAEIVTAGRVDPAVIPRYYATADIFCSSATGRESFGIVLLEAMACGIPVIASSIPGFRHVVTHGREGFLIPPHTPAAFADAILEVGSDASLRRALGARGREKALAHHWPVIVDSLERLLFRVVGADERAGRADEHAHQIIG